MLAGCSDCSRVDAVKATANQLKLQVPGGSAGAANPKVQAASRDLQSVDAVVKTNNATQAEVALSAARAAVEQVEYAPPATRSPVLQTQTTHFGSLDVTA